MISDSKPEPKKTWPVSKTFRHVNSNHPADPSYSSRFFDDSDRTQSMLDQDGNFIPYHTSALSRLFLSISETIRKVKGAMHPKREADHPAPHDFE